MVSINVPLTYEIIGTAFQDPVLTLRITNTQEEVRDRTNSPNMNNQYATIGGSSLAYDDAGNMTGDHNSYTYHYDYENRLTRVKKLSDTVDVAVYTYDALGRRIAVEDCIADTTTHYYYDGWRVLTETDENDDRQRDFAYGNYLDEALIMTVDDDDYYYAHDHLFSPVAIVDSSGDIQEYYQYDAYGKCTIYTAGTDGIWYNSDDNPQTTSTVGNPIFFTGQRLDELDTGNLLIMYYKNRYYLVAIGRFITHDPFGVRDGICLVEFTPTGTPISPRKHLVHDQYKDGMNLQIYVSNNPINHYDTFGFVGTGPVGPYYPRTPWNLPPEPECTWRVMETEYRGFYGIWPLGWWGQQIMTPRKYCLCTYVGVEINMIVEGCFKEDSFYPEDVKVKYGKTPSVRTIMNPWGHSCLCPFKIYLRPEDDYKNISHLNDRYKL